MKKVTKKEIREAVKANGNEEFCKKVVEIGNRIYQKKVVVMKEAV